MEITNMCLEYLKNKKWLDLNKVLSNEKNQIRLSSDPIFSIFQNFLVDEIKRHENEGNEDLLIVVSQIFNIIEKPKNKLIFSNDCRIQMVEYLFKKHPSEKYAKILEGNRDAEIFLKNQKEIRKEEIYKSRLSSNLDVKIGSFDKLDFSKSIFNSPQEEELYSSAKKIFPEDLVLPNLALSTIINSKITELLESKREVNFFFKSSLDLCIVNSKSFRPKFYIELDSSWHDKPDQIGKDQIKDKIFKKAGLKLYRLRKLENKNMNEIFQLFIQTEMKKKNEAN